jgi:hypothetical protein
MLNNFSITFRHEQFRKADSEFIKNGFSIYNFDIISGAHFRLFGDVCKKILDLNLQRKLSTPRNFQLEVRCWKINLDYGCTKKATPIYTIFRTDFQKLEREARICRKLHHPNIGTRNFFSFV